jgi:glycyl-tRNA synthetase beta chain
MRCDSLLIELFVEELPPKVLNKLGLAFAENLHAHLWAQDLTSPESVATPFASPRRLAVHITQVKREAPDKQIQQKLMPVSVGLNETGQASPALLKKLQSLGLGPEVVNQLTRAPDGKTEALFYDSLVQE